MKADEVTDEIARLFAARGSSNYGGEGVSQQEHALQAAWMAEQSGAPPAQIMAALLHDVGHLLHDLPDDAPDQGIDDVHEQLGHRWLRRHFISAVSEPVRMHVDAKRYLCAVDATYLERLSPPSVQSLELQGGAFTPSEVRAFETQSFYRESIELRRWDDLAKEPSLETPDVAHFLSYARAVVLRVAPVEVLQ